jgi:hypothetical protein
MEDYEPKNVIRHEEYDNYLLDLHRTIANFAEDRDPPSPFRGLIEEGDNIRIVVNDTNDLRFCIEHFQKRILDGELEHVIIGDPHTIGYSIDAIERMTSDLEISADWSRDKDWIIIKLNTVDKKIVIENRKIRVEK